MRTNSLWPWPSSPTTPTISPRCRLKFTSWLRGQSRRRFVQDQDPRPGEKGAPDGDPLLEAERQAADQRVGIDVDAGELRHQRGGDRLLLLGRHRSREQRVGPEKEVLDDRAFVGDQ